MAAEWRGYGAGARGASPRASSPASTPTSTWSSREPARLPFEFGRLRLRARRSGQPEDVVRIRSHGLAPTSPRSSPAPTSPATATCKSDQVRVPPVAALETQDPRRPRPLHHRRTCCASTRSRPRAWCFRTRPAPQRRRRATWRSPRTRRDGSVDEGSNTWAVAPSKSATGRPILANDPHRGQATPSLRYIVHLNAPGLNVIGGGEPALPGISIGHNGTHRLRPDHLRHRPGRPLRLRDRTRRTPTEYRYRGGWEPMQTRDGDDRGARARSRRRSSCSSPATAR